MHENPHIKPLHQTLEGYLEWLYKLPALPNNKSSLPCQSFILFDKLFYDGIDRINNIENKDQKEQNLKNIRTIYETLLFKLNVPIFSSSNESRNTRISNMELFLWSVNICHPKLIAKILKSNHYDAFIKIINQCNFSYDSFVYSFTRFDREMLLEIISDQTITLSFTALCNLLKYLIDAQWSSKKDSLYPLMVNHIMKRFSDEDLNTPRKIFEGWYGGPKVDEYLKPIYPCPQELTLTSYAVFKKNTDFLQAFFNSKSTYHSTLFAKNEHQNAYAFLWAWVTQAFDYEIKTKRYRTSDYTRKDPKTLNFLIDRIQPNDPILKLLLDLFTILYEKAKQVPNEWTYHGEKHFQRLVDNMLPCHFFPHHMGAQTQQHQPPTLLQIIEKIDVENSSVLPVRLMFILCHRLKAIMIDETTSPEIKQHCLSSITLLTEKINNPRYTRYGYLSNDKLELLKFIDQQGKPKHEQHPASNFEQSFMPAMNNAHDKTATVFINFLLKYEYHDSNPLSLSAFINWMRFNPLLTLPSHPLENEHSNPTHEMACLTQKMNQNQFNELMNTPFFKTLFGPESINIIEYIINLDETNQGILYLGTHFRLAEWFEKLLTASAHIQHSNVAPNILEKIAVWAISQSQLSVLKGVIANGFDINAVLTLPKEACSSNEHLENDSEVLNLSVLEFAYFNFAEHHISDGILLYLYQMGASPETLHTLKQSLLDIAIEEGGEALQILTSDRYNLANENNVLTLPLLVIYYDFINQGLLYSLPENSKRNILEYLGGDENHLTIQQGSFVNLVDKQYMKGLSYQWITEQFYAHCWHEKVARTPSIRENHFANQWVSNQTLTTRRIGGTQYVFTPLSFKLNRALHPPKKGQITFSGDHLLSMLFYHQQPNLCTQVMINHLLDRIAASSFDCKDNPAQIDSLIEAIRFVLHTAKIFAQQGSHSVRLFKNPSVLSNETLENIVQHCIQSIHLLKDHPQQCSSLDEALQKAWESNLLKELDNIVHHKQKSDPDRYTFPVQEYLL
ncbi:MAG TPA: hypothetical protein QF353_02615 [Gammaproteobacteria bacterium]|nr:hypothetical protein [Gammaproteobacteria bacterium]